MLRRRIFVLLCNCAALALLLLLTPQPSLVVAGDAEGFSMSLFNGRDLEGWIVTGCKAGVEDGLLVLQEGDGLVRSEHDYGDFVLELEWRARKAAAWDSGVYFRAAPPAAGKPWPSRYQANLEQGKEGNVKGLAGAESSGLAKPGQWNQLRLKVVGSQAELAINGQPAWKVDGVKPARGYIGFQAEIAKGGQFEFRNVNITELDHKSLFNGRDLTGWEGAGQDAAACWKVEDQTLLCTGQHGPWLRSKSQYGDFNLRLEYKLKPGGNSGVYLRVPADGNHRGKELSGGKPSGIEVQILDDGAERYRDLKDYQFCGSLYAIAAASPHVGRPAGHWNSMEIDCRGAHYRVIHNGVVVVDATSASAPELAERELRGFLGLQNHSEEVWFRNIRIAETGEQDAMRELQARAIAQDRASWGNMWGNLGAAVSPPLLNWVSAGVGPGGLATRNWNIAFAVCAAGFIVSGLASLGINAAEPVAPEDG